MGAAMDAPHALDELTRVFVHGGEVPAMSPSAAMSVLIGNIPKARCHLSPASINVDSGT